MKFASPFACNTAAVTPSQLVAGTDTLGGVATVNLSGTAFGVSGNACGSASSCTCSGTGSGESAFSCAGFTAGLYGSGAAAAQFTPAAQSMVLRADGACGWFLPSPTPMLIGLDGVVQLPPQQPACGGIPCGLAGSSCWAVQVTRNASTTAQTFWVGASGIVYLPLAQQMGLPFPAISMINGGNGNTSAPNSVALTNVYYSKPPQLTAYSCVRVNVSASGAVVVDVTDATFAIIHGGECSAGCGGPPQSPRSFSGSRDRDEQQILHWRRRREPCDDQRPSRRCCLRVAVLVLDDVCERGAAHLWF